MGKGKVVSRNMVSSSSWSSAYVYTTESDQKLFVKQSSNGDEGMFKGEALGLQAMYGRAPALHQDPHPSVRHLSDGCKCSKSATPTGVTCGSADTKTLRIPKVYHYGKLSSVPGGMSWSICG